MDASIIEAPSSTKNRTGRRDPEMHQTRKGNQWHFGMKAHIGVDSETGVAPSFTTTAANVPDVTEAHNLLHGGETWSGETRGIGESTSGRKTWGGRWMANSDEARSAAETGPGQRGSIGGAKQGINAVEEPAPDWDRGWSIRS